MLNDATTSAAAFGNLKVAVILPCLNEVHAITEVIKGFRAELPMADIYVVDNGSTDGTGAMAIAAGAYLLSEPARGKGNAVRRAFAAIDSDIYIMADGDGTYDSKTARQLINCLIDERLDIIGAAETVRINILL